MENSKAKALRVFGSQDHRHELMIASLGITIGIVKYNDGFPPSRHAATCPQY